MDYTARIRKKDGKAQSVMKHSKGVQTLSEKNGRKMGLKYTAGLAGLLHDLGKNTNDFEKYIQAVRADSDNPPRKGSVDHSTAGGRLLYHRFFNRRNVKSERLAVEWIAMAIISHHSGLRDFLAPTLSSDFLKRILEKELEQFDDAVEAFFVSCISEEEFQFYFNKVVNEVEEVLKPRKNKKPKSITYSFFIKYIFSCLIDADRTNSREFEEDEQLDVSFDKKKFFTDCHTALMRKNEFFEKAKDADCKINQLRREMSHRCEEFACKPSGIYTLSIPTGGGKTLASLRYALKHACKFGKDRIVYIVPYTTIIEQNAQAVRDVLGCDEHILEHHSNVIFEKQESEDEAFNPKKEKFRLAKDNWESPIIFTTMVQFLNVFYSKGTRNVRRLHNLTNAVLIFDEAQSVPIKCISLFNEALNFLCDYGHSSIVLCTATQPALDRVKARLDLSEEPEMICDVADVSRRFKRVNIVDRTTLHGFNVVELQGFVLEQIEQVDNLLIVLNTKAVTRKLFEQLSDAGLCKRYDYKLFHLSTNMCAAHRKAILAEVKEALEKSERVICVSTQLIEAGVDISFHCVIRSLAGLDSIAQAAGRCNRNGEYERANVYIVKLVDERLERLKEIKIGAKHTERILNEFKRKPEAFGGDILSPDAMKMFFNYFYKEIEGELNYFVRELGKELFDLFSDNADYVQAFKDRYRKGPGTVNRQAFKTAEQHFNVIDNLTTPVIVPYNDEANRIIADLNGEVGIKGLERLLKEAQQFTVNLYDYSLEVLDKSESVYQLMNGEVLALKGPAYSKVVGVDLKEEGSWAELIV